MALAASLPRVPLGEPAKAPTLPRLLGIKSRDRFGVRSQPPTRQSNATAAAVFRRAKLKVSSGLGPVGGGLKQRLEPREALWQASHAGKPAAAFGCGIQRTVGQAGRYSHGF
jgi:hypothetical protein